MHYCTASIENRDRKRKEQNRTEKVGLNRDQWSGPSFPVIHPSTAMKEDHSLCQQIATNMNGS